MASWKARKPIESIAEIDPKHQLRRSLRWPLLVALGIGAILPVSAIGSAASQASIAGPGVLLAIAMAGLICACAAVAYAEMATRIPLSGSAYSYAYVAIGELAAWIVGWCLILEFLVAARFAASGWAIELAEFLRGYGIDFPLVVPLGIESKPLIYLAAIFIVAVVGGVLAWSPRKAATINLVLVLVMMLPPILFVAVMLPAFNSHNLEPFMPFGFARSSGPYGISLGVVAAATTFLFLFAGFNAVAPAAEETRDPARDTRIGILGSFAVSVAICVAVTAATVGALAYQQFLNDPQLAQQYPPVPLADWLIRLQHWSMLIAWPAYLFALLYALSRNLPRNVSRPADARIACVGFEVMAIRCAPRCSLRSSSDWSQALPRSAR